MNVRILLSVLLFYIPVQAQTYFPSIFQGMGNTGLASESVYSISTNGAGIATLQRPTAALAYQPHFMTKDLRTLAAYCGIPLKNIGSFGFGVRNYGIAQVSSFLTGNFTYSRNFGNIFSTSLTANYHHNNVKNYIADNAFSLDLGALVKFGEQVNVGFLFRNATLSKFKDDTGQYLPTELAAGFLYKMSKELAVAGDVYYEFEEGINARGGVSYSIADIVILRGGLAAKPIQYFGGIGLRWESFQFDVSSAFHQRLGSSPQVALSYAF